MSFSFLNELKKPEPEESNEIKKPKIRCYLDFDGTLTKSSGLLTIESEFYRSLFVNPSQVTSGNYDKTETEGGVNLKTEEERWELIKNEFKEEGSQFSNLLITESAKRLLKMMIEINADIIVVSKNRKEYIKDMFKWAGFSKEEITKFTIYDVRDYGGNKFDRVTEHEMKLNKPAAGIVIADDSKGDYDQMLFAINNLEDENGKVYSDEKIIARNCVAGEFNGDELIEKVQSLVVQKQSFGMRR